MRFTTLIVDDEPPALEGLRMWLGTDPDVSSIQEAKDGREAVAAIRNASPDLVFLDVQMPEIDGFPSCTKLARIACQRLCSSRPMINTRFRRSRSMRLIIC
jgi:YesN/AraC family two-component response regulator